MSQIPDNKLSQAKNDVGEFVKGEILRSLSSGKSPVKGERFKKLSKEYADEFKGGDRTPNLELEGDLLDALEYKEVPGGVEIGVFKESEQGKADGHNNFTGLSKLPKRRFIPNTDQDFKSSIQRGVDTILNEYRETSEDFTPNIFSTRDGVSLTVDDALGESFDSFLQRFFSGQS